MKSEASFFCALKKHTVLQVALEAWTQLFQKKGGKAQGNQARAVGSGGLLVGFGG